MFTARHVKDGKMLLKGVTKFIHYKRDVLSEEALNDIREKQSAFRELLKTGSKEEVKEKAKELQKVCERAVPMPSMPGLRENVEVFFVAIVIALGIRAYFLQPFKIPTGSMQPTLNGIIAKGYGPTQDAEWEKDEPGMIKKAWELVWNGRNYVDVRAEEDFVVTGLTQKSYLKFFSFTFIERETMSGQKMKPIRIWAPLLQTSNDLGLASALNYKLPQRLDTTGGTIPFPFEKGRKVSSGALLARGFVDTGDQVLVNKFSYHFRTPNRGEVFVFTTAGIEKLRQRNNQSQHYIKRLAGLPGDQYEVRPPELYLNGERATEPGIVRVMEDYDGYTFGNGPYAKGTLEPKRYLALGDNSANSYDSRGWGSVPEKNLVGPALFVYWPFGQHWGLID